MSLGRPSFAEGTPAVAKLRRDNGGKMRDLQILRLAWLVP